MRNGEGTFIQERREKSNRDTASLFHLNFASSERGFLSFLLKLDYALRYIVLLARIGDLTQGFYCFVELEKPSVTICHTINRALTCFHVRALRSQLLINGQCLLILLSRDVINRSFSQVRSLAHLVVLARGHFFIFRESLTVIAMIEIKIGDSQSYSPPLFLVLRVEFFKLGDGFIRASRLGQHFGHSLARSRSHRVRSVLIEKFPVMRQRLIVATEVEVINVGELKPGFHRLLARRFGSKKIFVLFSRRFVISRVPCFGGATQFLLLAAT